MAPRGPRGQAPSSSRETRSSGMKSKPATRGGIQKRRAGATRVDGDGDLDMDAPARRAKKPVPTEPSSARTRPTRSSAPTGPKAASRTAQTVLKHLSNGTASTLASRVSSAAAGKSSAPLTFLRIRGLKESKAATNPDGGRKDLRSFLERKASSFRTGSRKRNVAIKKLLVVGDYVYVGASEEDAEELLKLNNFIFAGARLEVVIKDSDDTGDTKNTIESEDTKGIRAKFESVLSQRYLGPPQKLLRLDALAADAELVNLGALETKHKPERPLHTFRALMAICGGLFPNEETQPAIESISLTNNGISDVEQVETVATTFPRLKHLDMSGNKISTMQGLRRWKGQFRSLETIYMTGNPIETVEPNYQAILLEWFPTLQNINGNQVRTPIPQDGLDFRDVGKIGENFLLEFFTSYDTDRQSLASRFYDETSQFSLAVDERSVRDPNAPAPKPWTSYLKFSRNMIRIEQQNARMQRLFRGANVIYDVWKALPPTRHPDIKQEMSKYIMDCHPLPGLVDPNGQIPMGVDGLIVAVHGEFEEADPATNTVVKRSFSRTFVLGPGQPGKGPTGIRVVSDMLSLRAYSPLPNIFAQASAEENRRQTMIVELSEHTRLRLDLSRMCLEQANWDYGQALVILEEAKKNKTLPDDAFTTQ